MSALPSLAAGAAALGAARWWYPRAVERAAAARLPAGPDGIIVGAEPVVLEGNGGPGVLLLHGFGDTPQSVRMLALALHARGWTVHAPLLAGHGRTLGEFARSSGDDWVGGARAALRALVDRCAEVSLVGQSLGGALATLLAAESPGVRRIALLAPYFDVPSVVRRLARFAPLLEAAVPYLLTVDDRSIHDPAARAQSLSFGATTPRLTIELMRVADRARAVLPQLRVPTLYIQAREDNRIAPSIAARAYAALGAPEKRMVWLDGSGHVVAADAARDQVAGLVGEWLAAR